MDPRRTDNRRQIADSPRRIGCGRAASVLVAEDDHEMRTLLVDVLRAEGYEVAEAQHGVDVLLRFVRDDPEQFDLIISDIRMPGVTGLEFLEGLREQEGFPPTVLITAFGDAATHAEAIRLGAVAVVDKPFEISELLALVRRTLARTEGRDHATRRQGETPGETTAGSVDGDCRHDTDHDN
jgi:DNA-binding response OmpR family regulator